MCSWPASVAAAAIGASLTNCGRAPTTLMIFMATSLLLLVECFREREPKTCTRLARAGIGEAGAHVAKGIAGLVIRARNEGPAWIDRTISAGLASDAWPLRKLRSLLARG